MTTLAAVHAARCLGLPILGPLCTVASSGASAIASASADLVLAAVVRSAVWLLDAVGHAMSSTTTPSLGAPWFTERYTAMVALAGAVVLLALLATAIEAVLRGDVGRLGRALLVHLPIACLVVLAAVPLATAAMAAVDQVCAAYASATGSSPARFLSLLEGRFVGLIGATGNAAVPGLLEGVLGVVAIAAGMALWVELLLRSAAIAIVVLFVPVLLAAQVWPAAAPAARRGCEVLCALVVSKFVVVAALCLGVGALSSAPGLAGILLGAALVVVASFSPFLVLRLVPLVEGALAAGLEGQRQRATRAVATGVRMASTGASMGASMAASAGEDPLTSVLGGSTFATPEESGLAVVEPMPPREEPTRPRAPLGVPAAEAGVHVFTRDRLGPVFTFIPHPTPQEDDDA